ncbi:unnamed protein product [Lactuca saligna]|uniref:Transposase MuDR plant domain-containing protein n=1 Tax=Lactuca saligna TaxID=75948 RepID=A0AA35ZK34_LACSI|nr:unnamed protein product [Lactuca saligna]
MAVESEVHHESSEEYEDDEEVLDTEHIDVEMEEVDFKTQGKERCKDAFLNFSYDYEDNEADEDNDLVDEDEEGFGSEEEIDDTAGANDLDLGDAVGAGFPIHDPSVKWNKMKPLLGERYESPHQLQQCLTNYAIKSGYNIKFAKCDTVRLTAKCGSKMKSQPCPFRVHASWMTQESHWTRGGVRGGVRGSRGGAMGSRGGRGGNRGGAVGNIGGVVANRGGRGSKRGGRGSKRGGRGSKTSVRVEGGGGAEVEGDTVENEDDTIPEKYLVHLWKSMQDLKQSGYSIEEIKNSLSLTDSRMKQLNDYNDTIEQVLPMSMEEGYPPQTETQDGGEEIIHETQPESEEEEEEGVNDTQELPVHLRIIKRRRPLRGLLKTS